jgi:hypothetical protein
VNYAVDHDRYRRTWDGWKFTERVCEVRYLDTTPLAGSAPHAAGAPANPVGCVTELAHSGDSAADAPPTELPGSGRAVTGTGEPL